MKKRITPIPQVVGDGRHYEFGDDVDFSKFVTFYWAQAKMLNSSIMLEKIFFFQWKALPSFWTKSTMCILLFPFPKIKNPQKSLDVFLFRSLQLYWSVTILLDLLGKKWKFRLLRPLQQPILNWSSSLVLCLMPGCNMFGEVMASHIILRNTTTTNYVTGKPYTLYADQFSRQKLSILR